MHAQREYGKVLKMKSTYSLDISALLFVLKLAMHLLKESKGAKIRNRYIKYHT